MAKRLTKPGSAYRVLNAVPMGTRGSDIDHLVIGPTGVFTLNTKSHRGRTVWVAGDTVMVDGQRQRQLRNSRFEAQRVAAILSRHSGYDVAVTGVVVVVRDKKLTVREQPRDSLVRVTTARAAVRWIRRQRRVLDKKRCCHLFELARRSTTWTTPGRR